jgi:hypothetical protein
MASSPVYHAWLNCQSRKVKQYGHVHMTVCVIRRLELMSLGKHQTIFIAVYVEVACYDGMAIIYLLCQSSKT